MLFSFSGLSGFIQSNNHVVFNKSNGNIKASDQKGTTINNDDAVAENSLEARFASSIQGNDGDSSTACKQFSKGLDQINLNTGRIIFSRRICTAFDQNSILHSNVNNVSF